MGTLRRRGALAASALVAAAVLASFLGSPGDALPPDRGLVSGSLPSGLSWYLRPTTRPEDRLVFRLVVAAGSARELEGERGYAHFVEHMAFNGTSAYPGNSLDDLLESLDGGLDLEMNAFTYPDYTVFHLELPAGLSADRGDSLSLGFRILRQWISELRFDPEEVEREKGVIRAEMREYDSPEDRLASSLEGVLYGGTPLADRGILGTPESVDGADATALRAFYSREYLPSRAAVIASGPFEAPDARRAMESAFADLPGRSKPVRAPALIRYNPRPEARILRSRDERRRRAELGLVFREPSRALRTRTDWTGEYRARLAERVLSGRLADLGAAPEVPWFFLDSDRREDRFGERLWTVRVSCTPGAEAETLRALGRELGALRVYGADPGESETAAREVGLTLPYPDPDAYEAVESAIRQFLYGDASLDPGRADDLEERLRRAALDRGSPPTGTVPGDLPDPDGRLVFVARPGPGGPSDAELSEAFLSGICEGRSNGSAVLGLREPPSDSAGPGGFGAPGGRGEAEAVEHSAGSRGGTGVSASGPESRMVLADGTVELGLANGLRIRIRATGSGEGWAYLGAWSPGGLAAVPPARRPAADEAPGILARAGYPERSPGGLRAALAGTGAVWKADAAAREESVEIDGSAEDLDLLFRLLAASFRAPRVDPEVLRKASSARAEELRLAAGPESEFLSIRGDTPEPGIGRVGFEEAESWTADAIRAAWADRFGDPGDFEFLAVGDFDLPAAEGLAREHLGSLGEGRIREPVPPLPPAPAPGLRLLDSGNHPRGRVLVLWSLRSLDAPDLRDLDDLARALEYRLFRRLREESAETYDVFCSWEHFADHPGAGDFRIEFEAAPGRARSLAEEALRVLADFESGEGDSSFPDSPPHPPAPADDQELYRLLLDRIRAERAGVPIGTGPFGENPGMTSPAADEPADLAPNSPPSPERLRDLAARLLSPDRAAVFVLGRGEY